MILFSLGLPGRFADWCNAVLASLAGHLGGSVATISFPPLSEMFGYEALSLTLDTLARRVIAADAAHLAIAARQPDERLCRALARRDARFVLALGDPLDAVADILAETDCAANMAVRAIANSCPLLTPFAALPGMLPIRAEDARVNPAGTIAAIAAHFGIAVGADGAAAIAAELAPRLAEAGVSRLAKNIEKMAEGALGAYRRDFAGERLDRIVWTRDLFHLASNPVEPVEVGGPSRILIYGPYIHLPPGQWSAQIVLGFSPEAAMTTFLVDVYAEAQLASTTFQPGRSSIYTADLIFSVGAPSGKGVEVRVWVSTNAGSGRLAFGRVVLQPLAMPDTTLDTSADFARVLEL